VEGIHNSKELLVVHLVVDFGGRELAGKICDHVKLAIVIWLLKYTSERKVGRVSSEGARPSWVEMSEHRLREERGLEFIESVVRRVRECKEDILFTKGSQWNHNGRIMVNEAVVNICKAQKGLNVFDGARLGPRADRVELLGVHLDTVHTNYITEVGDLGPVWVSKEASFLKPVEHFLDMLVMFSLGTRGDQISSR
jgi:hypothetical protein